MRIFISWSGRRSREVATVLAKWLPTVLPSVEPWISEEDIRPGDRWSISLQQALTEAEFGILCVTRENVSSAWLLFEAGAISRSNQSGSIVPLLVDLVPADLPPPLREFQSARLTRDGLRRLCRTLNGKLGKRRQGSESLDNKLRLRWPRLAGVLKPLSEIPKPPDRDLARRLESLGEFSAGMEHIAVQLESRGFKPDVAIGCSRSGAVLAGALATNIGIPYVVALDRVTQQARSQELRYEYGGLVQLRQRPKGLRVLLCVMLAETGDTIDACRRVLRQHGWPHEPGKGLEVVALFASGSVRNRRRYVIVGCDGYRGWSTLDDLPYMFRKYDLRFLEPASKGA